VVSFRDEYGAGLGIFGYDGNPRGLRHIIDLPHYQKLYQHPQCDRCGVISWWSTPEPMDCPSCKAGRVARNDNADGIAEGLAVGPEVRP
jgi:hypothetical protein